MRKLPGELRGLFLGDSVAMGEGVDKSRTFVNQLEAALTQYATSHRAYQMINTGVQGYGTREELHVFKQSLRFEPDFVVVAYSHNDVFTVQQQLDIIGGVEPRRRVDVLRQFWGDQIGVWVNNYPARFLINETGLGRLIQRVRIYQHGAEGSGRSIDFAQMAATSSTAPQYRASWTQTKALLAQIYTLAFERGIRPLLLILPDKTILHHPERHHPVTTLLQHARDNGVDALPLGTLFERYIDSDIAEEVIRPPQSTEELAAVRSMITYRYLFDGYHLTSEGHRLIAKALALYLDEVGIVDLNVKAYGAAQAQTYQTRDQGYYIRPTASMASLRETILGLQALGVETAQRAVCRKAQTYYRTAPEILAQLEELCGME